MKKFLFVVLSLYGAYYYVSRHYDFESMLVYAKKHPQASWVPATEYYVGMMYYQRENYGKANEVLKQLLTDFPTCQYVPGALVRYEDVAETNHDWDTAKAVANRYVEDYPNGGDIEVMRKRLELLNYHHP